MIFFVMKITYDATTWSYQRAIGEHINKRRRRTYTWSYQKVD